MRFAIFGSNKRPLVGSQNTGRDAYERPFGVGTVTVNGVGGFSNFRSLSPVSQSSFNRPVVATVDLTGTGNALNTNPNLEPLIDKQNPDNGRSQF